MGPNRNMNKRLWKMSPPTIDLRIDTLIIQNYQSSRRFKQRSFDNETPQIFMSNAAVNAEWTPTISDFMSKSSFAPSQLVVFVEIKLIFSIIDQNLILLTGFLYCLQLYNKKNITRRFEDMNFILS